MQHMGTCGLCRRTNAKLQRSHLYPAAVYKQLRDTTAKTGPNPVFITHAKAVATSKQATSYFLCSECEHRFSVGGERYVLAQCLRLDGQFKLRELLEAASPLGEAVSQTSGSPVKIYDAQHLLGSAIDQYLYFAASIFWRASAHSWKIEGKSIDKISLGPYEEDFRRYLLSEAPFPQNARLWVMVASERDDLTINTVVGPCTVNMGRSHRHKFWIGGIGFVLFLGSDAVKQFDANALNGNGQQRIWLAPWRDDSLFQGILKLSKETTPSGKLRK